jgi:cardiolipin synthase
MQSLSLLFNGDCAFERIEQHIREASVSIYIRIFIWRDDVIGNRLAELLIDAADRGVKVTLVKDKTGSIFEKGEETRQSFFNKEFSLKENFMGAVLYTAYTKEKCHSVMQSPNTRLDRLNNHPLIEVAASSRRDDHSKIFIFDDRYLIMGGMNIEDKEIWKDLQGRMYFDYMVEIESSETIVLLRDELKGIRHIPVDGIGFIMNTDYEGQRRFDAENQIIELLSSAEKSIDIVMSYLDFGSAYDAVRACLERGVRVRIIIPEYANLQNDLNRKVIKRLMTDCGSHLEVFFCFEMIHAKMLYVDRSRVTLGSINLNKAGMRNLKEANIYIDTMEDSFKEALEQSITTIIEHSRCIYKAEEIDYRWLFAWVESAAV